MTAVRAFEIVFAVGVVAAAASLAAATLRVDRRILEAAAVLVSGGAVPAWVFYALRLETDLALCAAGLTVAAVATGAAVFLVRGMDRAARIDERLVEAESRLTTLVEREAADRAAELERTLARARADGVSLLSEEERRIADERRASFVERERQTATALAEGLAKTQKQVEQRLEEWSRDLDRAADVMRSRLTELSRRQQQLTAEAEQRIAADGERLRAESEEQRETLVRWRSEIERAIAE